MKKVILILGMLPFLMLSIMSVMAYDESSPYTVELQWVYPIDTSFSVTLCDTVANIHFNLTSASQSLLQPGCQNNNTGVPILNITNDGNINMNFQVNLTASKPAWATLYAGNVTDSGKAVSFDTTGVPIMSNLAPAGTFAVYLWTTTADAETGTTDRTFQLGGAKVA